MIVVYLCYDNCCQNKLIYWFLEHKSGPRKRGRALKTYTLIKINDQMLPSGDFRYRGRHFESALPLLCELSDKKVGRDRRASEKRRWFFGPQSNTEDLFWQRPQRPQSPNEQGYCVAPCWSAELPQWYYSLSSNLIRYWEHFGEVVYSLDRFIELVSVLEGQCWLPCKWGRVA